MFTKFIQNQINQGLQEKRLLSMAGPSSSPESSDPAPDSRDTMSESQEDIDANGTRVEKIKREGEALLKRINELAGNINAEISPENLTSLHEMRDNLQSMLTDLDNTSFNPEVLESFESDVLEALNKFDEISSPQTEEVEEALQEPGKEIVGGRIREMDESKRGELSRKLGELINETGRGRFNPYDIVDAVFFDSKGGATAVFAKLKEIWETEMDKEGEYKRPGTGPQNREILRHLERILGSEGLLASPPESTEEPPMVAQEGVEASDEGVEAEEGESVDIDEEQTIA